MARITRTALPALLLVIALVLPASAGSIETPLVTGGADQGDPAVGTGGYAWTVSAANTFVAMANTGAADFQVNPSKSFGAAGGIDGDTLIYQKVGKAGSDIAGYDLAGTAQLGPVPDVNTKFWEWGASISGDWVLLNRNNINYTAPKEWQRVMLVNTSTGEKRTLAQVPGSAYLNAGQVNGNWAVWESFTRAGGWKVIRYDIASETRVNVKGLGGRDPYAPAVAADGTVYYAISGDACGRNVSLVRRKPDETRDIIHSFPSGTDAWELYEFTDATPEQDLYYERVDCGGRVWKGDVYYIDAADSIPPLGPVVSPGSPAARGARAETGAAHRPPPELPEAHLPA